MLLGLQSVKQVSLLCLDKMLSLLLIHHHYADGLAPCGSLTQWVAETQYTLLLKGFNIQLISSYWVTGAIHFPACYRWK